MAPEGNGTANSSGGKKADDGAPLQLLLAHLTDIQKRGGDVMAFISTLAPDRRAQLHQLLQATHSHLRPEVARAARQHGLDVSPDVEVELEVDVAAPAQPTHNEDGTPRLEQCAFSAEAATALPAFGRELRDMVVAFGGAAAGTDTYVCTCAKRGASAKCQCTRVPKWLQGAAKDFGRQVVQAVDRGTATRANFNMNDLKQLLPCEMAEYTLWLETRKRAKTKPAGTHSGDAKQDSASDNDSVGTDSSDESDQCAAEDSPQRNSNGSSAASTSASAAAAPPTHTNGNGSAAGGSATKRRRASESDSGGGAAAGGAEGAERKLMRGDYGYSSDLDPDEYVVEATGHRRAAVRARMEARMAFADLRTSGMGRARYKAFAQQRAAFFLSKVRRGAQQQQPQQQQQCSAAGAGSPATSAQRQQGRPSAKGSPAFFMEWLGYPQAAITRHTAKALAFLVYDHIGMVVEEALRHRQRSSAAAAAAAPAQAPGQQQEDPQPTADSFDAGVALSEPPSNAPLTLQELRDARTRLPRLVLPQHHDGIRGIALPSLPLGIRYVGDPRDWPCGVVSEGVASVRGRGGRVLQLDYKALAAQADAIYQLLGDGEGGGR